MASRNHSEIILEGGRFIRRNITSEDLGSQEKILAGFAESNPVFIRNAAVIGSRPVHQLVNKGTLVLLTELDKLPFDSNWAFDTSTQRLLPQLNSARDGSVVINEPWIPPVNFGRLIFAVKLNLAVNGFCAYNNTYLFRYSERELHHFPYPNLFDDCRVCMGRDFERASQNFSGMDAISVLLRAQTSFYETRLNADLHKPGTFKLFARNLEGQWIIPPDFRPFNNVVSSAFMRGFDL